MCCMQSTKVGRCASTGQLHIDLPSCSLPCFKTHAAQCTYTMRPAGYVDEAPKKQEVRPNQAHSPSSEELNDLFTKHPGLRGQLQDIYKATVKSDEKHEQGERNSPRGGFNSRGRGSARGSCASNSQGRQWTPDKGFDAALKRLERAMAQDAGNSEGLQAFADVVLRTKKK